MKVLYIKHNPDGSLNVEAGADSSVLRPGEPVFVPDPVSGWRSTIAPAVRISRLGTAIKASRASAYYDAIAPVHILTPASSALCDGLPPYILDRTLSPGLWQPLGEESGARHTFAVEVRALNAEAPFASVSVDFSIADAGVDTAMEVLSRHLTFRTGDILVFPDCGLSLGVAVLDTELRVTVDGAEALKIRMK